MQPVEIVEADLNRAAHQHAVVKLIDAYARDPMGNGKPLSADTRRALIPGLQQHPTTVIFLAYQEGNAIGIALCFLGFSTFAARPLINIHDLAVLPANRGQGAARRLIEAVERKAREMGCCFKSRRARELANTADAANRAAGLWRRVPIKESSMIGLAAHIRALPDESTEDQCYRYM